MNGWCWSAWCCFHSCCNFRTSPWCLQHLNAHGCRFTPVGCASEPRGNLSYLFLHDIDHSHIWSHMIHAWDLYMWCTNMYYRSVGTEKPRISLLGTSSSSKLVSLQLTSSPRNNSRFSSCCRSWSWFARWSWTKKRTVDKREMRTSLLYCNLKITNSIQIEKRTNNSSLYRL